MKSFIIKYLLAFSFLTFASNLLSGQDLIVTIFNDSIHCKIDQVNDTFVYFRTRKTKRNSSDVISRKEIADLIYNFDQGSLRASKQRNYRIISIYGEFTGSRLLSEIPRDLPNEFSEYLNGLKWGLGFSAGVNFMFSESMGLGLTFSQTDFENSVDVMQVGTGVAGTLSDDIRLTYMGLGLVYSGSPGKSKSFFQVNAGLGYLWYLNRGYTIYPFTVKSASLGGHIITSINFDLGSGIYLPVGLGLKGFTSRSMEVSFPEELPDEFREGITREVQNNDPAAVIRLELNIGLLISF